MKIILGTMTFGDQVNRSVATKMLRAFSTTGYEELDTAYVYHNGETEKLLGRLSDSGKLSHFRLAGKANPKALGGLTPDSVRQQLYTSLERLQASSLDLFYLHAPDLSVPIHDTLQAVATLHGEGKFQRFGLSNYAAWQVAEIVEICRQEGWIVPTVYQGMYNALTRDVERELFSCLHHYQLAFYAYNPLAGGLLSGKHPSMNTLPGEGRFATFDGYQERYWKPEYFTVVNEISAKCRAANVEPAAAAIRWLVHHSALTGNRYGAPCDGHLPEAEHGVIIGASSMAHLSQNINAMLAKPLTDDLIAAYEDGWSQVRQACIKYFRP